MVLEKLDSYMKMNKTRDKDQKSTEIGLKT